MRTALALLGLFLILLPAGAGAVEEDVLWFFWGEGCPACREALTWLDGLARKFPELTIHRGEVWQDPEQRDLYLSLLAEREVESSWVPGFILDASVWQGFNGEIAREIEAELAARFPGTLRRPRRAPPPGPAKGGWGRMPLLAATVLIALANGFNPCALWVLTILLAMVLHCRSRGKTAAVGVTFLVVSGAVYGLFVAGVFAVLSLAGSLVWIRWAVAILALVMAALNIADFFRGQGDFTLAIPPAGKPGIIRRGRELSKDRPLPLVLAMTAVFAAGVTLLELPCTAGFPVVWTKLAAEAGVEGPAFWALLLLYILSFLVMEGVVVGVAVLSQRVFRLQERHGRDLKLVGGMILLTTAGALLIKPAIMEGLTGALLVLTAALLAAGAIGLRRLRARSGGSIQG